MRRVDSISPPCSIELSHITPHSVSPSLVSHVIDVNQSSLSQSSFPPNPIVHQPNSLSGISVEVDIGRDDVSADVKRDNLGCLSVLTNISYTIGNLWRSAKNEYIKQLENNVTKALNKLAYDISSEREELVARMIPLLVTDEETARKYVTTVIEKARFESLIELLKE